MSAVLEPGSEPRPRERPEHDRVQEHRATHVNADVPPVIALHVQPAQREVECEGGVHDGPSRHGCFERRCERRREGPETSNRRVVDDGRQIVPEERDTDAVQVNADPDRRDHRPRKPARASCSRRRAQRLTRGAVEPCGEPCVSDARRVTAGLRRWRAGSSPAAAPARPPADSASAGATARTGRRPPACGAGRAAARRRSRMKA